MVILASYVCETCIGYLSNIQIEVRGVQVSKAWTELAAVLGGQHVQLLENERRRKILLHIANILYKL